MNGLRLCAVHLLAAMVLGVFLITAGSPGARAYTVAGATFVPDHGAPGALIVVEGLPLVVDCPVVEVWFAPGAVPSPPVTASSDPRLVKLADAVRVRPVGVGGAGDTRPGTTFEFRVPAIRPGAYATFERCLGGDPGFGVFGPGAESFTVDPAPPGGVAGETATPGSGTARAAAIAVGTDHACALLADRTVRCWGSNRDGQLGDGTTTDSSTAVAVRGIITATAIAAGGVTSCAILAGGTVECWGGGHTTPAAVPGITTASAIAAGDGGTCVILADRTMRCWGSNDVGQLGDGTTIRRPTPVAVRGISAARAVAIDANEMCLVLADGSARCAGYNGGGQLGDGTTTRSSVPVIVHGLSGATAIAVGGAHACAVLADGTLRCWGDNLYGELGAGTGPTGLGIYRVSGITTAVAVAAGEDTSCALLGDGTARCWGRNWGGTLGNGSPAAISGTPVAVHGIGSATAIAAGGNTACAILADGSVWCWGGSHSIPVVLFGPGLPATSTTPVRPGGRGSTPDLVLLLLLGVGAAACSVALAGRARR